MTDTAESLVTKTAYDAARDAMYQGDTVSDLTEILEAAAPHIVAAYLRKMAAEQQAEQDHWEWSVKRYVPGTAGQTAYDQITRAIVLKAEYLRRADALEAAS